MCFFQNLQQELVSWKHFKNSLSKQFNIGIRFIPLKNNEKS
mgnify:CR=1 FL=1